MKGLLVRAIAAFAACFLFSQSAEFTQQYLQRLGGAADALGEVVARFDEAAASSNMTRNEALARLKRNSDVLVVRQGDDAAATVARYETTEDRYRRLVATAPLFRPFVALSDADWSVADRTREDYRPALPVTIDGFVLAIAGFALGWALGASAHGAARMAGRRRRDAGQQA